MIVYVLVVIAVKTSFLGSTTIDTNSVVFKDAAQCLSRAELAKKRYSSQYNDIKATCVERKVEE